MVVPGVPLVNFGGPPEVVPVPLWKPPVLGLFSVTVFHSPAFVSGFFVVLHPSSVVVDSTGLASVVSFGLLELKNFLGPESVGASLLSSFDLNSDRENPVVGPEVFSLLAKPPLGFFSSPNKNH